MKYDKIIRSKRKTIALQITEDAKLIVKAPIYTSEKIIENVIERHQKWLNKKIKEIEKRSKFISKKFIDEEQFLYLGKFYKLKIVDKQSQMLEFNDFFTLRKDAINNAKQIFINWYKNKAFEVIKNRVGYYAKLYNFNFNKINITNAKKRWGSCSFKGNLNFSLYLVMAPLDIIDYVVVHELAHLIQKNHSKKYWEIVKKIIPEYKTKRYWLKENGNILKL